MTHNLNTQPIQCNYDVSKENINSVSRETTIEPTHFPIYLQIKENYFKVQLENDLYLPVTQQEFYTKAQPIDNIHQKRHQCFRNNYPPPEN